MLRHFLLVITRNLLGLLGAAITTAAAFLMLTLFGLEIVGVEAGPYLGILTYLILPAVFVVGLLLIPLGSLLERRRARRATERGEALPTFPVIDLNRERTRKLVLVFSVLTFMNLVILSVATYKGVEVMETTRFCGTTCHVVMEPEYTAYQRSPHARVKCVSCHVGPGASEFLESKLAGADQVISLAFGLYARPIPVPVEDLRGAEQTCGRCHRPAGFVGDRLEVKTRFKEDEANTPTKTVLLLRVGGLRGGISRGIHWHADPGVRVRYEADEKRQSVRRVEVSLPNGTVRTFTREKGAGAEAAKEVAWRAMDCTDCHNRSGHAHRSPQAEVDLALEEGRLDRSLPYIRREGVAALIEDYDSHERAHEGIRARILDFYSREYPEISRTRREEVAAAGEVLGSLYGLNVFPTMNVRWGTYPSHVGHQESPGCFRCHDEELKTAEGEAISQDCSICHAVLAVDEESPEILGRLQP